MIGKKNIKPTKHYLRDHSDVDWDLIILTILSPSKTHLNKRRGKDRFTYTKIFQKFIIEIHTKNDLDVVWVINAFKTRK